ncbi:glycine cleavage system protein GcvH [candidate division WOR-3 bacterium]|nr:glycine cleavage system protein GcvH [candidate division WOR-3 bacterium]
MEILEDLLYTEDHEWVRKENGEIVEGITDYAQSELSDIVYVELPDEGRTIRKGEAIGTIEAVKTVIDVIAAVSGTIIEVNRKLDEHPESINEDPYEDGWIVRIKVDDPAELETLLDASEYNKLIKKE